MTAKRITCFIAVVISLSPWGVALAQEKKPPPSRVGAWMSLGLGLGSRGIAGVLDGNFRHGPSVFSLQLAGNSPIDDYNSNGYGALYGRGFPVGGGFQVSASAGLGAAHNCYRGGHDCAPLVLAVPLSARISQRGEVVGIALVGFTYLNREETFSGVALALELGKLK